MHPYSSQLSTLMGDYIMCLAERQETLGMVGTRDEMTNPRTVWKLGTVSLSQARQVPYPVVISRAFIVPAQLYLGS